MNSMDGDSKTNVKEKLKLLENLREAASQAVKEKAKRLIPYFLMAIAIFLMVILTVILLGFNQMGLYSSASESLRILAEQKNLYMGTAVIASRVTESGCNTEPQYCQILGTEYNLVSPENAMKFSVIHPQENTYDFSQADAIVAFAQSRNMKVRGVPLVWSQQIPSWVTNGGFSPLQLENILQNHINTVVSHFKTNFPGVVIEWDVVNEGSDLGVWGQIGTLEQVAVKAFAWARQADPSAKLYYNDYGIEDYYSTKSTWAYNFVKNLKNSGVPIDGVGLESHFTLLDAPSLSDLEANLTRYANAGLEVKFTELDVRLLDNSPSSLAAQANIYKQVLTACINISSCKGLLTWGFTDKYSWIPQFFPSYGYALPYDTSYNPKPAYTELLNTLKIVIPYSNILSTIHIQAYGTPASGKYPRMELRSGSAVIGAWDVTETTQDYSYITKTDPTVNNLRVYFTNNALIGSEDRNLTVLSLTVNDKTYLTKSPNVYSLGTYTNNTCNSSGYFQAEVLYCNGFFEYPTIDSIPPSLSITSPLNNATISGTVLINVDANDASGVAKVEFYADNQLVSTDTTAPYSATWDTTAYVHNSTHNLTAKAYDPYNNIGSSALVSVKIQDITPPFVSITSPANNSLVSRNITVTIQATASDVSGISKVEFYVGSSLKCTDTTTPYICVWKVPAAKNILYTIQAKAYDIANNTDTTTIKVTSR